MAGSFSHCTAEDGSFRFNLIENFRDAYEACEMMHWMIRYLSWGNPRLIQEAAEMYFATKSGQISSTSPEDAA